MSDGTSRSASLSPVTGRIAEANLVKKCYLLSVQICKRNQKTQVKNHGMRDFRKTTLRKTLSKKTVEHTSTNNSILLIDMRA